MILEASYLDDNPIVQFTKWFHEAEREESIELPNAMCISTIDDHGFPDSRYVLMKAIEEDGIIFYTNLLSTKGESLKNNKKIAANFYWQFFRRQVRMKGASQIVEDHVADEYFATRDRKSQIGAWASKQSKPLESKSILFERVRKYTQEFKDQMVPRPNYWSGFKIIPHEFEFWQNGENRLHDRFRYSSVDARATNNVKWTVERLYP